ncbi:MAG: hypothetical protein NUV57_05410 [archaeon]|nr:hypothetical protein [archaeon]
MGRILPVIQKASMEPDSLVLLLKSGASLLPKSVSKNLYYTYSRSRTKYKIKLENFLETVIRSAVGKKRLLVSENPVLDNAAAELLSAIKSRPLDISGAEIHSYGSFEDACVKDASIMFAKGLGVKAVIEKHGTLTWDYDRIIMNPPEPREKDLRVKRPRANRL